MAWRLKGCSRCAGDLMQDDEEWRCLQCGHYCYPSSPDSMGPSLASNGLSFRVLGTERKSRGSTGRATRNINAFIRAKNTSDERWWGRNRQTIAYLDEGLTVREIALRTTRGQRQVRMVRERLADLRAQSKN